MSLSVLTIPAFARAKIIHALDCVAINGGILSGDKSAISEFEHGFEDFIKVKI
jgi:hypothetical protein